MVRFPGITDAVVGSKPNGSNSIVSFTVLCDPCPPHLDRARTNGHHFYDPNDEEKQELRALLREALREAGQQDLPLFGGSRPCVELGLRFYFKRPKSHLGKRKRVPHVRATAPRMPGSKDTDNVSKFWNDAMETILFANDRSIKSGSFKEEFLPIDLCETSSCARGGFTQVNLMSWRKTMAIGSM